MIELACQYCGSIFYRHSFVLKTGRGKYCSRKCSWIAVGKRLAGRPSPLKGRPTPIEVREKQSLIAKRKGFGKWMTGKRLTEETRKKISIANKGGNRTSIKKGQHLSNKTEFLPTGISFQGTPEEYKRLHYLVRKEKGRPLECQNCGKKDKIEWANKSRQYLDAKDDWISLCRKCHFNYDRKKQ